MSQVGPGFAKPQSGIAAAHGALDQPAGNGDVARRHGEPSREEDLQRGGYSTSAGYQNK